jgi:transformation/transcription domain-associated protein
LIFYQKFFVLHPQEKYRIILFQQIIQPFCVSGTHLQQRDLYPYSSLNTLLEAFYVMFKTNANTSEFVPIIRPVILKYIGKTHNTWHGSVLLLEQYILDQQSNHGELIFT